MAKGICCDFIPKCFQFHPVGHTFHRMECMFLYAEYIFYPVERKIYRHELQDCSRMNALTADRMKTQHPPDCIYSIKKMAELNHF